MKGSSQKEKVKVENVKRGPDNEDDDDVRAVTVFFFLLAELVL